MQHKKALLPSYRLVNIRLHTQSTTTRPHNSDIEIERHKALSELLQENSFQLRTAETAIGPYHLTLGLDSDSRLMMKVHCTRSAHQEDIRLGLTPLHNLIRDYSIICDNFIKTARAGQLNRLEAIDAGRRATHDEGAEILLDLLNAKVILDKTTARRLFSLIYVLHIRNTI